MNIFEQKELLRKTVYDNLFYEGFSNRKHGDYGKIPDFKGSDIAALNLSKTEEWISAKTIFCSPDSAQIPVRYLALKDCKNLIMASPNLEHGYLFLNGKELSKFEDSVSFKDSKINDSIIHKAATKEGAFDYASRIDAFPKIDLVVEGSVAVDNSGNRIGKGKGFADKEIADLFDKNLISNNTPLLTTIHPLQLVDFVPMESHDMKLNMIVTTDEVIMI